MDVRTRLLIRLLTLCVASGAALPLRADEADDQYAVAAAHYGAKRWDLAAAEFQTLLERFPSSAKADEAAYFLGESLVQAGRYRPAADAFARLLEQHPATPLAKRATFRRGEALHLAGDAQAAEPVLRAYLETNWGTAEKQQSDDPAAAHAWFYHGATLLALGQPERGARQFDEALKRVSAGTLADMCRLGKAQSAEDLKQWDEAARAYEALAAATSENVAEQARLRLGMLQARRSQFASAVATLKPLVHSAADTPLRDDARYWTAVSLQQAGHSQGAFDLLLPWTVKPGPRQDEARLRAGLALQSLGRQPEAVALLKEVKADGPWAEEGLAARIRAAAATGDEKSMDDLYGAFCRRYPASVRLSEVTEQMARRAAVIGKHGEAVRLLESRLGDPRKDNESDRRRRYLLVLSYVALQRNEDALRQLDLVIASTDRELKARALISQGTILISLGRFKEAVAPLTTYLEMHPEGSESIACRGQLAVCLARSGRLAEARELDRQLHEKHPRDPSRSAATLALAAAAQEAGQRDWAEALWRRVAKSEDGAESRGKAMLELARSQFAAGNFQGTLSLCKELLARHWGGAAVFGLETWGQAALLQGAALEKLGRGEEALAAYREIWQRPSQAADSHVATVRAALVAESLGKRDEAIRLYHVIAFEHRQSADTDMALYRCAWLMHTSGNEIEAAVRFYKLHREYPQSRYWADATYRLADAALKVGRHDVARRFIMTIYNSPGVPRDVLAHALLREVQRAASMKDWPSVEIVASEIMHCNPPLQVRQMALFWLAEAAYRQQKMEEAENRFDTMTKHNVMSRDAWVALVPLRQGQLAAARRDWGTARRMVEKLRSDWPQSDLMQEVEYLAGRCLAAEARFDEARAAYTRAIRDASRSKTETAAMAQWMLGETYFHQQRYDEAVREYLRVEALYGYPQWQAAALMEAGKCYEALGRPTAAVELYRRVVDKYSQTMFYNEARQRLQNGADRDKAASAAPTSPERTQSR